MFAMVRSLLTDHSLGIYPSIGLLIFFGLLIAICFWVFRPGSKKEYERIGRIAIEK